MEYRLYSTLASLACAPLQNKIGGSGVTRISPPDSGGHTLSCITYVAGVVSYIKRGWE